MKYLTKTLLFSFAFLSANFALASTTAPCCKDSLCVNLKLKTPLHPIDPYFVDVGSKPQGRYLDIGEIYVSRYNFLGMKRQLGTITNIMRDEAAKYGGNDIQNIKLGTDYAQGEIIRTLCSQPDKQKESQ